jgi:hypothetical protein
MALDCHPERSEGPGFLLDSETVPTQARTEVPRCARDDNLLFLNSYSSENFLIRDYRTILEQNNRDSLVSPSEIGVTFQFGMLLEHRPRLIVGL